MKYKTKLEISAELADSFLQRYPNISLPLHSLEEAAWQSVEIFEQKINQKKKEAENRGYGEQSTESI